MFYYSNLSSEPQEIEVHGALYYDPSGVQFVELRPSVYTVGARMRIYDSIDTGVDDSEYYCNFWIYVNGPPVLDDWIKIPYTP